MRTMAILIIYVNTLNADLYRSNLRFFHSIVNVYFFHVLDSSFVSSSRVSSRKSLAIQRNTKASVPNTNEKTSQTHAVGSLGCAHTQTHTQTQHTFTSTESQFSFFLSPVSVPVREDKYDVRSTKYCTIKINISITDSK